MKRTTGHAGIVVASLAAALALGACSSANSPASPGASPAPNAPEVNPAGDIPDNQVYVPFTTPDHRFTVSVPEGWARSTAGNSALFTDKFNSVRVETTARPQAPTTGSATAEELPAIRTGSRGYVAGSVSTVARKAGNAVLITYQADSPPDPVTGKSVADSVERYEFWNNGEELVLTLSGPKGADNVDPWRTITDSVRWM